MKRFATWLISAAFLLVAGFAHATPEAACTALGEARTHLVAMLDATDKATQDDLKGKVHAASAKLDEVLAAMSKGPDAAKASEFKAVWEEFKNTRETEIIPHVYAGKKAEAKAIATGIQAERMKKMKGVMGCK
jgi:Four helix bundle sensory module for signal transduction